MNAGDLRKFERDVWAFTRTLRGSPEARLRVRKEFYKKYGQENDQTTFGYGDSEIAFLTWEERSVLRPLNHKPPGSAWWNDVNLWFIYLSELGWRAYEAHIEIHLLPVPTQFWIKFIQQPSASNWYKAHNASIIDGYLRYSALAEKESIPERIFINMVLYRLLYAQSLVEGDTILPRLFQILGDPRGRAVQLITGLSAYYPAHYPMTQEEIRDVLGKSHSLAALSVEFLDDVLIEPELTHLYHMAAVWNNQPRLLTLIKDHKPVYPGGKRFARIYRAFITRILVWIRKIFSKIMNL